MRAFSTVTRVRSRWEPRMKQKLTMALVISLMVLTTIGVFGHLVIAFNLL